MINNKEPHKVFNEIFSIEELYAGIIIVMGKDQSSNYTGITININL